jgi:hypothetical protein
VIELQWEKTGAWLAYFLNAQLAEVLAYLGLTSGVHTFESVTQPLRNLGSIWVR